MEKWSLSLWAYIVSVMLLFTTFLGRDMFIPLSLSLCPFIYLFIYFIHVYSHDGESTKNIMKSGI